MVAEAHAPAGEPVEVGCLDDAIAQRCDGVEPLIVREDEDDIGLGRGCGVNGRGREDEQGMSHQGHLGDGKARMGKEASGAGLGDDLEGAIGDGLRDQFDRRAVPVVLVPG